MYHRQGAMAKAAVADVARPFLRQLAPKEPGFSGLMAGRLVVARLEPGVSAKRAQVFDEKI